MKKRKLNYEQMIADLYQIMEDNDGFLFEMDTNLVDPKKVFLKSDSRMMVKILGQYYMIIHGYKCSCGSKYLIK